MASVTRTHDALFDIRFQAMASPCSVLLDSDDDVLATQVATLAETEALRIEHRYSRYRNDNIIFQINTSDGKTITVSDELADLLDFADQLYRLSDGLFDISSGALRKIWRFADNAQPPTAEQIQSMLPLIGWHRVHWQRPELTLKPGMEIDLGGIGKEYSVDRVFDLIASQSHDAFLVNFGGDLRARGPKRNGEAWQIGIERPDTEQNAISYISLTTGAITTSGDSRRFLQHNGVRYGHILNPLTGYPVMGAPRSVTVIANTTIEAGAFSTLAMLQGANAETFLSENNVKSWCVR